MWVEVAAHDTVMSAEKGRVPDYKRDNVMPDNHSAVGLREGPHQASGPPQDGADKPRDASSSRSRGGGKAPSAEEVQALRRRIVQATAKKTSVMTPEEYAKVGQAATELTARPS